MRRSWGILILLACVASFGAAPSAASDRAPAPAALPELPPEVEALAARERAAGSNLMLAQIMTRPYKGYRWSVVAYKANPSARTFLGIAFARSAAQQTQLQISQFSWALPSRALRMDANLRPASLMTRDGMGTNGSISMKLSEPGKFARVPAPDDCSGSISVRVARFDGPFRFHARDRYFKRIRFGGARVVLYREHDLRCEGDAQPGPPSCPEHLSLDGTDADAGVAVGASKTVEGKVDQVVVVTGKSGDADALHVISVTVAVPEAFEASEDMTSAHVDGDAAGPWLSGDLSYVAPPPGTADTSEECGPYRSSSGLATGDYTAHFDSLGPVAPASTGLAATLRREI